MSLDTISVKRYNHRVYPCNNKNKEALLAQLIQENNDKSILVVTSQNEPTLQNIVSEKVSLREDTELLKDKEFRCDMLISYDLPETAITYMVRIAHATEYAFILLDEDEHKKLYPIETLLGRTLKQEILEKFAPEQESAKPQYKKKNSPSYIGKDANGKAMFAKKSGERNHRYDGTPKSDREKVSSKRRKIRKINIKSIQPKEQ